MILTVTPNPCVDKTFFVDRMTVGTKNYASRVTCIAGGKGNNVSRVVKVLGRPTKVLTIVGGHTGEHIVEMLREDDGIEVVPLWVASSSRTITTVLETEPHVQTPLFEPGSVVTREEADRLVELFGNSLDGVSVVTLCGTVPDRTVEDLYARIVPIARARGIITILDSHGPEFAVGIEAGPDVVKPNVQELEELVGRTVGTESAIVDAGRELVERGIPTVVISQGSGSVLVVRADTVLRCVPPEIDEVNPVGSGDAFVAGLAVGLTERMELEPMVRLAVAAGTANAMSWDIGHCRREEIEALIPQVVTEKM